MPWEHKLQNALERRRKKALSVLGATSCERPHETHKDKYKRKKTRSKVCEYFFEFILSVERLTLVFTCSVA